MNIEAQSPQELTPEQRQQVVDFISANPAGVIATVTPEGDPQASVVYFSADPDLNIFFTTKQQTRKAQNLAHHAKVSLSIYEPASQAVVKLAGAATRIEGEEAINEVYRKTVHASTETGNDVVPPIAKVIAGDFIAFTVKPEFVAMIVYGQGNRFAKALEHATDEPTYGNPN